MGTFCIYKYYYYNLSTEERNIYDKLSSAIKNRQKEVLLTSKEVPQRYFNNIDRAFEALCYDNVLLFYADTTNYKYTKCPDGMVENVYCEIEYDRSKMLTKAISDKCFDIARKFADKFKDYSNYEKALYAHDFLTRRLKYNEIDGEREYTLCGPLMYGKGVCAGIAKSYKLIMDLLNVPCIVVESETHAWNMVRLGANSWAHVDVTFDLKGKNYNSHFCFGLCDRKIKQYKSHIPNRDWMMPRAENENLTYYHYARSLVHNSYDVEEVLKSTLKGNTSGVIELSFDEKVNGDKEDIIKTGINSYMIDKPKDSWNIYYYLNSTEDSYIVKVS